MPALLADETLVVDSISTYERSVAWEDLLASSNTSAVLFQGLRQQLSPDVLDFLTTDQGGVRAVTRSMIDRVLRVRSGQGVQSLAEPEVGDIQGGHDELGTIFRELPTDAGHWGDRVLQTVARSTPARTARICTRYRVS